MKYLYPTMLSRTTSPRDWLASAKNSYPSSPTVRRFWLKLSKTERAKLPLNRRCATFQSRRYPPALEKTLDIASCAGSSAFSELAQASNPAHAACGAPSDSTHFKPKWIMSGATSLPAAPAPPTGAASAPASAALAAEAPTPSITRARAENAPGKNSSSGSMNVT